MRDLAEDVRATVDFFLAQSGGAAVDRLLITGGASQTDGLAAAIAGHIPAEVLRVNPFSGLTIGDTGLAPADLERATTTAAGAVGLALWPFDAPAIRLSVLPDEVAAARRARRMISLAACGVAGLALVLGLVGAAEVIQVHSARSQVSQAKAKVTQKTAEVATLQAQTAIYTQMSTQAALVATDLQGEIDWVRVLGQVAGVMPASLNLAGFTGVSTAGAAGVPGVGTLNFSVKGTGGLAAVAQWMRGLQRDKDLSGTWVSGVSVTPQSVAFSSSTNLTPTSYSNRSKAVLP
jgi:hypothetical protein